MSLAISRSLITLTLLISASEAWSQQTIDLRLQFQKTEPDDSQFTTQTRDERWLASETAIIICDVWDYHHCLNAVRRLEQFTPRLNDVLMEARRRGVIIIHSPSDCMEAYRDHSARRRAKQTPKAAYLPHAIESWCAVIPSEERAVYPIDQSDGGEDDDPVAHAEWAAKLEMLGRNPNMPWKKQSDSITIDEDADYISDRGDEVWNILENHNIKNVILTGVHTNMCVLGRPFGLRQMVRNGKNVALMRDMTDTMYNPKRWPFVSHFEGTRRVISHIERFVCPTITSDQLIGGQPFRFAGDSGKPEREGRAPETAQEWVAVHLPVDPTEFRRTSSSYWYRCVVRIPESWTHETVRLKCRGSHSLKAWINGTSLAGDRRGNNVTAFTIPAEAIEAEDHNLIVLEFTNGALAGVPVISAGSRKLVLRGWWQMRHRQRRGLLEHAAACEVWYCDQQKSSLRPSDPLWTPRAVTRPGEFTERSRRTCV